jgi:hypothetical protein
MVDHRDRARYEAAVIWPSDSRGHFIEVRCQCLACSWSTTVTGHGAANAAVLVHQRTHQGD